MRQRTARKIMEQNEKKRPLDEEWVTLFKSAKEIGLSIDEIRNFLCKTDHINHKKH